jgi:sarcosine oxidase subunit beta
MIHSNLLRSFQRDVDCRLGFTPSALILRFFFATLPNTPFSVNIISPMIKFRRKISADVAVIGGGIMGCAVAYYLSASGVRVALVERGALSGGASGSCGGFLFLQSKRPGFLLAWARESLALYRELSTTLEADLHFQPTGGVIVATTRAEEEILSAHVEQLRRAGVAVEMKRKEDLPSAFSRRVRCFSFCADDAQAHPQRVVEAFAQKAQAHGATFLTGTPAVGIATHNDRVTGVITERGEVDAPVVVNAAGVFAPEVARWVGVRLPIRPRRGQLMETSSLPPCLPCPILDARYLSVKFSADDSDNAIGLSLQQRRDGTVLMGGTREWTGFDVQTTSPSLAAIQRRAAHVVPSLRRVSIVRAYAGLRPATPDGFPIVGFVERPAGFCIVAGHEGDGITLAPVTGRAVANLIGQAARGVHESLAPQRFSQEWLEETHGI